MTQTSRLRKSRSSLRPVRFKDYIGQEDTKEVLQIAIKAAKELGLPLDHVLLNGPPGLGKTTLSKIIANEMDWKIKTAIGSSIKSPKDVEIMVLGLPPSGRTMIFIDEIHRVSKPAQEILYPVLEDGVLMYKLNYGTRSWTLPGLTVIGATTNVGSLAQPFVDRFGLQFQLEFYDDSELLQIAKRTMAKLNMHLRDDALVEVIHRSRATPRIVNRLLKRLLDFRVAKNLELNREMVASILWKYFHLDGMGLLPLDRKVLGALAKSGGSIGLETLAVMVAEDPETIETRVEPYLIRLGFMVRELRGRSITDAGRAHITS